MAKTAERRLSRRYEVDLVIRHRVSEDGKTSNWRVGTTCDISTGGIGFRCRAPVPVGAHVEMIINWPAKQDGIYPMYLHAIGTVVRSRGRKVGVRMVSRWLQIEKGGASLGAAMPATGHHPGENGEST